MLVLCSGKPLNIIMSQDIAIATKPWRLCIRIVIALLHIGSAHKINKKLRSTNALVVTIVFAATKATKMSPLCLMLLMLHPKLPKGTHAATHARAEILLLGRCRRIKVRGILTEVGCRLSLHLLGSTVLLRL